MLFLVKRVSLVLFFFLLVNILNWVNSADYKELRDLGVSCYPRDSCQCSHYQTSPGEGNTCECDPSCYRRGTCCIDSPYVDPRPSTRKEVCSPEQIRGISHFYYFSGDGYSGYSFFQVNRCHSGWSGSPQVRQVCEMGDPVNGTDLMVAIPVTNTYSGISYKNYFCAICNNDIQGSVLWDFSIHEDYDGSEISDRFTLQAIEGEYYHSPESTEASSPCNGVSALVFNDQQGYGYWDYCSNSSRFVPVTVDMSIPEQIQHLVKGCSLSLISSCSPGWTDIEVKVLCESYLGIIKGPPQLTNYGGYYHQYYRNAHCALCNNVTDFEGYSCVPFSATPILTPAYQMSATILFGHLLADEECLGDNEKFIKGLGCRSVICRSKQKVKNRKCTPL